MRVILLYLMKGKKANEGEIRKWKSGYMMKIGTKWISVEQKDGKWVKASETKKPKAKPKDGMNTAAAAAAPKRKAKVVDAPPKKKPKTEAAPKKKAKPAAPSKKSPRGKQKEEKAAKEKASQIKQRAEMTEAKENLQKQLNEKQGANKESIKAPPKKKAKPAVPPKKKAKPEPEDDGSWVVERKKSKLHELFPDIFVSDKEAAAVYRQKRALAHRQIKRNSKQKQLNEKHAANKEIIKAPPKKKAKPEPEDDGGWVVERKKSKLHELFPSIFASDAEESAVLRKKRAFAHRQIKRKSKK